MSRKQVQSIGPIPLTPQRLRLEVVERGEASSKIGADNGDLHMHAPAPSSEPTSLLPSKAFSRSGHT